MGKRKERRLAAKSAAGRRVKLDLFAEPIGKRFGMNFSAFDFYFCVQLDYPPLVVFPFWEMEYFSLKKNEPKDK